MSFKVAVASTDDKYVNQHFGKADKFLIFDISGPNDFKFLQLRENNPYCGSERKDGKSSKDSIINLLLDCRVVLVTQIGPGASEKLKKSGITPLMYSGLIENALIEISQNTAEFI